MSDAQPAAEAATNPAEVSKTEETKAEESSPAKNEVKSTNGDAKKDNAKDDKSEDGNAKDGDEKVKSDSPKTDRKNDRGDRRNGSSRFDRKPRPKYVDSCPLLSIPTHNYSGKMSLRTSRSPMTQLRFALKYDSCSLEPKSI